MEDARRQIEAERLHAERLLLNVLPKPIAEELKRDAHVKPRHYRSATVLFADFSGFTKLAEKTEPSRLILQLPLAFRRDRTTDMKVFVAGGTGAIGRHAVPALVRSGHQVTALARTTEKAALLSKLGVRPVMASIFDRAALKNTFAAHDAVVNLAIAIPPTTRFMQTKAWADTASAPRALPIVDAAIEAGVPRVVQESVSMIYRDRGDVWIDEDWPTDDFPMAHAKSRRRSECKPLLSRRRRGRGAAFRLVLRPGARHSEEFLALARRGISIMMMGPPNSYVSSIHVADGGAAVTGALTVPAGTYNVIDDEPLTKRAYADALAAAAGRRAYLRFPGRLALLLRDRSTSLTRSLRVSNARFRAAAKWAPKFPSARQGWMATAEALEQRQA